MTANKIYSIFGKTLAPVIAVLSALLFAAGCTSTKITKGQILTDKKLPRPETIWVHDFVAAPKDIQAEVSGSAKADQKVKPLTPEEKQLALKLGKNISAKLIQQINDMGMKAETVTSSSKPKINDLVLCGYLYLVDAGDATERIFIGLGYGASVLHSLIEGYQMTPKGLHKLSSADIEAASGQMPGGGATGVLTFILLRNPVGLIVAPAVQGVRELSGGPTLEGRAENTAVKIAEVLKERFRNAGWIKP